MDLSSLTRPRAVVAAVVATAAVSVGLGMLIEHWRYARWGPRVHEGGGGLHRRNAVRRPRRHSAASETAVQFADENDGDHGLPGPEGGTVVAAAPPEMDDGGVDERWLDDMTQAVAQRAGQNIVSLLFRVSEDNARRSAYVHRGCACNACGIVPIRGIRYRCANCADFDLCETCESQGLHTKTHIFYKVKVPAPPFGPRQMQPVWYPGDPDNCMPGLPRTLMTRLSRETGFERQELEAFWEQWTYMANTEWRDDPDDLCLAMDRKTFERCLVPSGGYRQAVPNLIHDRMFAFYDTNHDGLIGFAEFLHGLSYRKRKDKLRRIFDGYDTDRDGYVSRRDFLRFFRAYFVLYKQMHKDIIEGLDDQAMGTPETHQLVAGRTPLSSLFGREGRVPPADLRCVLDGKMRDRFTGEVTLHDGVASAVSESKSDTAARNAILASLFARVEYSARSSDLFDENAFFETQDSAAAAANYWDALLDPPTSVHDLPALLVGSRRDSSVPSESIFVSTDDEGDEPAANGATADDGQAPSQAQAQAQPAHGRTTRSASSQRRAQQRRTAQREMNAKATQAARKKLHERWIRRQFYLDEEEGGLPPTDWDDAEDVLVQPYGPDDGPSSAAHPAHAKSPRSRSSSKVRFAEDPEDYEIRSNPSTSSRSVPERWGGMDIPGAERDAGQEILYQVMQQAFNELLDILFKNKEELAISAAQTKSARDEYRHLFASLDVGKPEAAEAEAANASKAMDNDPFLNDLLARSGYQVLSQEEEIVEDKPVEDEVPQVQVQVDGSPYRDPTMPQFRPDAAVSRDALAAASTAATVATSSGGPSTPAAGTDGGVGSRTSSSERSERGEQSGRSERSEQSEDKNEQSEDQKEDRNERSEDQKEDRNERSEERKEDKKAGKAAQAQIPQATLVEWKKVDLAEQEAAARGGWGKLDYDEFEAIFKEEEACSNRLDYLGSWIDFCIP